MTPLYAHQQRLLDQNPSKCLIAWMVGTGKTRMALELVNKNDVCALVVCPKMLKPKWIRDAELWNVKVDVVTKEEFRRDYKGLPKYDAIIVDEAHLAFSNFKSQTHKALAAYIKVYDVKYRWFLTGTPYTSSPWSIYSLAKLLDYNLDFWNFRNQFFTERYFGQRVVFVPREGCEDALADIVKRIGSVVHMDECTDVPEQVTMVERFPLTKEQKKLLDEVKLQEQNPLARFSKYHQIASGTLLGNEFVETVTLPAQKNEYIRMKVLENEKVVVFCRYNAHIDLLAEMCKKEGVPYRIIRGDVVDRDTVIRECEEAKRMVVLINTACSAGYELPSFGVVIFASLSYSFVDYLQARGRVLRLNKPKKNVYIVCITTGSADVPVWDAVGRKQNFSEAIFARDRMCEIE